MDNPNPEVKRVTQQVDISNELVYRVYNAVRTIKDPEHPNTLEELSVVEPNSITITEPHASSRIGTITINIQPTVPHCSLVSMIGLCIRARLQESKHVGTTVPKGYKVDLKIVQGSHQNEEEVEKQLNDKERVAAALENPSLYAMVSNCLDPLESENYDWM